MNYEHLQKLWLKHLKEYPDEPVSKETLSLMPFYVMFHQS